MNNPLKPKVLAIVNQKGGVGKTTTAINVSASLAEQGKKVLLIDLDPQANATSGIGLNGIERKQCIYDALIDAMPLGKIVEKTNIKNLSAVPATIQLAGAEIELVSAMSRETKLKRALLDAKDKFEFVIIDCPPSLGLLTINALTAADSVIIPVQCEYYALEGLGKLLESIKLVQANLNSGLEVTGIVMTMHDTRTKLSQEVVKEVKKYFKSKVFESIIPRNVRLSEAPSHGQPIVNYDRKSRGAEAYRSLAKEVVANGNN